MSAGVVNSCLLLACWLPDFLTLAGTSGQAERAVLLGQGPGGRGCHRSPRLHPPPPHRNMRELAGSIWARSWDKAGGWGGWHQAVIWAESQYMKGAFPPHIPVLAFFSKESDHSVTFIFLLSHFSSILTHPNL